MKLVGTRVGRLKAVFKFPDRMSDGVRVWTGTLEPMAYVEWYTRLPPAPDDIHGMYNISTSTVRTDGTLPGRIVPLSQIRQSCQLIPHFGREDKVPSDWNTNTVLDLCKNFLLNNWASMYAYQTLW